MAAALCAVAVASVGSAGFTPTSEPNMNGEFVASRTPNADPSRFPKHYRDYPGGVEYYDVYSPPMSTLYSQVWWAPLAPAPLPAELVSKYKGKGMALVGWEIDQVRRTATGDVSVPISATYNHHYVSQMIGAGAKFKKVMLDGPDDPRAADLHAHGRINLDQPHYVAEKVRNSTVKGATVHTICSSANGGEYRKSFHGFAPGHALVIESPTELQITPMQIDTWNRAEMNISGSMPPKFVAGPLPRSSQAPPHAEYSGLLECPMTTRLVKVINGAYAVESTGMPSTPILTFQECFHAAASTLHTQGQVFFNQTGSDSSKPAGCSVTADLVNPLHIHVFFNDHTSTTSCSADTHAVAGATVSIVNVSVLLNASAGRGIATMTLSGPDNAWFGVGFNASSMADQPWTIIIDGNGAVSERKLGAPAPASHVAGVLLKPSVSIVQSSVSAGIRSVVLSRPMVGAGQDYFTFDANSADSHIPIIVAVGTGPSLAYHKAKFPTSLTMLPVGKSAVGACICPEKPAPFGESSGELVYNRVVNQTADVGNGAVAFKAGKCPPFPRTTLIPQRNPTCDIRHYTGGQWACHHMWSLLDADQAIPWPDQPLVFHHKWRLWVQPYDPALHQPLHYGFSSELTIGSPYEYDVPKCEAGIPGCTLEEGTWVHAISGSRLGDERYAALNFHCHAPTCLSMAVYACDEETPLSLCNATVGKLVCLQQPVYGGTNDPRLVGTRFDEPGYIAIGNAVWGSPKDGLEVPLNLTGVPLHMVKRSNATYGHYGEMAGGQPFTF